jgi:transketolase
MFFDSNDIQLSTETSQVTSEDTAAKYRAWAGMFTPSMEMILHR